MPKTPTTERETATFRLPAALLERARRDGAERGLAYVRSIEEALEVYFFARLPPPMAEASAFHLSAIRRCHIASSV